MISMHPWWLLTCLASWRAHIRVLDWVTNFYVTLNVAVSLYVNGTPV